MTGLTPGDYKVFRRDSVDEPEEESDADWFDPEWLNPYKIKGESVYLEESDRKSVNLGLIKTRRDTPGLN
jgi:hypothetical protein